MGHRKQEKIEVGVKPSVHYDFDFGLFPSAVKIKVPKEQWIAYVQARYEYEMKHKDILDLVPKKHK